MPPTLQKGYPLSCGSLQTPSYQATGVALLSVHRWRDFLVVFDVNADSPRWECA